MAAAGLPNWEREAVDTSSPAAVPWTRPAARASTLGSVPKRVYRNHFLQPRRPPPSWLS